MTVDVGAASGRVREAGRALRARPPGKLLRVLAEWLEGWRDPASAPRAALEAELPDAVGFSAEGVREGLARALAPWSGEALLALARAELGPGALGEGAALTPTQRIVRGFDLTAVLLAGALPTPSLLALLAPLAVGSPVLAKPASADPVTARVVAASLADLDAELGAALAVVPFASHDDARLATLLEAECVVATGSDATVAAVAARLRPGQRLVARGHRLSVALLGPEAHSGSALAEAISALALDVALWDQLGCLSPVALYVVGGGASACARAAERLAEAMAEAELRWPRGRMELDARAAFATARAEAELRAAAGDGTLLFGKADAPWAVVGEADAVFRGSPLHRFVRVHPASGPHEALRALRPLGPHLAAAGLAGFGARTGELAGALAELGASRICRFGTFQAPPLGWCQDNQGVLLPLTRLTDLEVGQVS